MPLTKFASKTDNSVTENDGTVFQGTITQQEETWTVQPKTGPSTIVTRADIASTRLVPYAIFVYAGMLPWLFFQASIVGGGMSLVSQQNLLAKIYLPRLLIPTATIGSALIDMALSAIVFAGMMLVYHHTQSFLPSSQMWALLPLLVLTIIGGLGISFLLSALTVNFRDMRFLIPFLSQILMWLSGAMYPPRIFGEHENWLSINPVYGVISAYRSAITSAINRGTSRHWASPCSRSRIFFIFGLAYFKRRSGAALRGHRLETIARIHYVKNGHHWSRC